MSGCRYFLSIVDDYSRRVWVHFLRHKNEAFSKFKEWKQLVENQTGRKQKKLRTDNGLEFCNQKFNNLCKESGIARHLTVAGTPQQNGLAERMFGRSKHGKVFTVHSGIRRRRHLDLWSGHPANYEMLRIFGCVAYSHVNQGNKLSLIISGDVVFNESLMYKDTLKGTSAANSGKEVKFEVELQGSRNLDNYVLVRDRVKRTTTIPAKYRDEGNVSLSRPSGSKVDDMAAYAFSIAGEEDTHKPITFQEAINSFEKDKWVRAMKEEMSSLKKNHTWELVDQPPGIDYNEVFSPVVSNITSIRVSLSLTACEDYELNNCMWKTAFLHGNLEEKHLYEAAPGFDEGKEQVIMLIACKSKSEIEYTKGLLRKEFDMKELGPARKILGMKIVRDRGSRTLKLKGLLIELGVNPRSVVVNCDNQSAIYLSRNAMFHERTKHINVRYHFIREIVESKEIGVVKIGTKDNAADAFTKVVPGPKFKYCMKILGVGIN
ncbi:retrotransposon protein, putative, ty1-copia subclass [Tanacetum coccineum]